MAKQQRGSTRTQNKPATPPASPARKPAGKSSSGSWQPTKVSAGQKRSSGPNRTMLATIGAVVVGLAIVAFVAVNQLGGSSSTGAIDPLITPGAANSTPSSIPWDGRTLGNANAKATIDLWGDFRCSACYQFTVGGTEAQVNNQLVATGQARVVWHDFTVIDLHDNSGASLQAANAAFCAADQNKFWTMHDWLYANQSPTEAPDAFTKDRLLKIGEAAGLDMTAFTPCVQNGTHVAAIQDEQKNLPAGVNGTPSTLVNGTLVNPAFAEIQKAVAAANGG
jgi:protein-disulfide isomerase